MAKNYPCNGRCGKTYSASDRYRYPFGRDNRPIHPGESSEVAYYACPDSGCNGSWPAEDPADALRRWWRRIGNVVLGGATVGAFVWSFTEGAGLVWSLVIAVVVYAVGVAVFAFGRRVLQGVDV